MTANAPPPEASILTARYCGFACNIHSQPSPPRCVYIVHSDLDQIAIPGILRDAQVVVAVLLLKSRSAPLDLPGALPKLVRADLLRRSTENVPCSKFSMRK